MSVIIIKSELSFLVLAITKLALITKDSKQ